MDESLKSKLEKLKELWPASFVNLVGIGVVLAIVCLNYWDIIAYILR